MKINMIISILCLYGITLSCHSTSTLPRKPNAWQRHMERKTRYTTPRSSYHDQSTARRRRLVVGHESYISYRTK